MSDPLNDKLTHFKVPPASQDAVSRILQAARTEQSGLFDFLNPLRELRAILFYPPVRMGVMAAVVMLFVALGLLRETPEDTTQQMVVAADTSIEEPQAAIMMQATAEELEELDYFERALEEQDQPFQDFLVAASFSDG